MKISVLFLTIALMAAANIQAFGEFVPSPDRNGGMANLVKRSLCNTFGGCGAKRSITPHQFGGYKLASGSQSISAMDQTSEDKRAADSNAKLISEILEDIVEHLKQDRNYKQGKYIMFVPRPTADGSNYLQRLDASVVGGENAPGGEMAASNSGTGTGGSNGGDNSSPIEQSIQRTPTTYNVRNADDGW